MFLFNNNYYNEDYYNIILYTYLFDRESLLIGKNVIKILK